VTERRRKCILDLVPESFCFVLNHDRLSREARRAHIRSTFPLSGCAPIKIPISLVCLPRETDPYENGGGRPIPAAAAAAAAAAAMHARGTATLPSFR
jgi:hypothetical protein